MQPKKLSTGSCDTQLSHAFHLVNRQFRRLCSRLRRLIWRRPRPKLVVRRFGKLSLKRAQPTQNPTANSATPQIHSQAGSEKTEMPIRIATFNVAMFSLAPAVPNPEKSIVFVPESEDYTRVNRPPKCRNDQPKSILKHLKKSPDHKLRVSINLPDDEISLAHNKLINLIGDDDERERGGERTSCCRGPMRSPVCFPAGMFNYMTDIIGNRTIFDVLRDVNADVLALQDVKAEEEKNMKPLSDLARALSMNYVFAESWAPAFGNAILSKWPIRRWRVQKIFDDQDFRNVLRATIEVPHIGEVNFLCTQLDHLDENWRMKQINAIIQSNDGPHILAGGLNSLDASDYSSERWADIVKYYEEIGKPTPKIEVMKFLKGKGYVDAKDFNGECEPVVIVAKGQNVQGTCKYGTRVDYVLASQDLPYKYVPGSYSVISSKGTSDHHIVKVEIVKSAKSTSTEKIIRTKKKIKQKVIRVASSCPSKGIWHV